MREKKSLQPTIFAVGNKEPKTFELKDFYIYFNGLKYNLKGIRASVQMIVEICVLFNFQFPQISNFGWLFIQEYFYGIKGETVPKVRNLINKLNHEQSALPIL